MREMSTHLRRRSIGPGDTVATPSDLELSDLLIGLLRHGFPECSRLLAIPTPTELLVSYGLHLDGPLRAVAIPIEPAANREIALIDAFASLENLLASLLGRARPPASSDAAADSNIVAFPRAGRPASTAAGARLSVPLEQSLRTTSDAVSASLALATGLLEDLAADDTVDPRLLLQIADQLSRLNDATVRFTHGVQPDGGADGTA